MALWKEKFLGKGRSFLEFPLLIKIIHAQETLSLQVHPTEKTASIFKGEPKNESWIMLEQGEVYLGFKKGVTKKIALKC
jgi:mannose-6-phosphate isomerase class I